MREVISNTSCLIVLDNIGLLYILKELYGKILITEEVAKEFVKELEEWVIVTKVRDDNYFRLIKTFVDTGEASVIALALETDNVTLILDDLKARKIAKNLGLNITGTIGVLLKARQKGIISSLKDVLETLKSHNFWISTELEKECLKYD